MTRPQKSSCCGAPLVLCKGAAWDVAPESIRRGSTYHYGCTDCRQATYPTPYTLTELRQQIRDHMWALAGDDETARGSVDYGDFLIDQLLQEVYRKKEPAIEDDQARIIEDQIEANKRIVREAELRESMGIEAQYQPNERVGTLDLIACRLARAKSASRGYLGEMEYLEKKSKRYTQHKCGKCGLFHVWKRKAEEMGSGDE